MPPPKERNILKMIFTNFINSFRPRQISGNLVGKDKFGNKFYEIPADRSVGKSKSSRWFVPQDKDDFMKEMPAEWESWLRGRRNEPPTEEEVMKNFAISEMTKKNAAELDAKRPVPPAPPVEEGGKRAFPKYSDYEVGPGDHQKK